MVEISSVKALNYKVSRISESFYNFKCLFVHILCRKILGNTAVVGVRKLGSIVLLVKEIIHIHIVDIPLDILEIYIVLLCVFFFLFFLFFLLFLF